VVAAIAAANGVIVVPGKLTVELDVKLVLVVVEVLHLLHHLLLPFPLVVDAIVLLANVAANGVIAVPGMLTVALDVKLVLVVVVEVLRLLLVVMVVFPSLPRGIVRLMVRKDRVFLDLVELMPPQLVALE